jgi:hypothetical protein
VSPRVREEGGGRGSGVQETRNGWGGGGLGARHGREVHDMRVDHACGKLGGDGSDRRGPHASERGRANERSALTDGARCIEGGRGAHARGSGAYRSAPPSRGRDGVGTREQGLALIGGVRLLEGECGLARACGDGLSWADWLRLG